MANTHSFRHTWVFIPGNNKNLLDMTTWHHRSKLHDAQNKTVVHSQPTHKLTFTTVFNTIKIIITLRRKKCLCWQMTTCRSPLKTSKILVEFFLLAFEVLPKQNCLHLHRGPLKTSPNFYPYRSQILTDFENSFTLTLRGQFAISD